MGTGGLIVLTYGLFVAGLFLMEHFALTEDVSLKSTRGESHQIHQIQLLDRGTDSLWQRLKVIHEAQRTLELEFFIFDLDEASRLITQALLQKAAAGVKVRILVDFSKPVFRLKPAYAKILINGGVQIKYYNTAPLYRFISSQHRSHRKILIADDRVLITGGRNIANDYFDLGKDFNFIDSDILIEGEIVKTARESFDIYFSSTMAAPPDTSHLESSTEELSRKFFGKDPEDNALLKRLEQTAEKNLPRYPCDNVVLVTDPPFQGQAHRQVFEAIVENLKTARSEVVVESPYFVIKDGGHAVLQELKERGIKVQVLTNGLHSTDAVYAVDSLYYNLSKLAREGISLSVMTGEAVPSQTSEPLPSNGKKKRWGLHSKRGVIDRRHVLIGTYNMDPRSANLNSELMIVCRDNPKLAAAVLASYEERRQFSIPILSEGTREEQTSLLADTSWGDRALFIFLLPVANLFDFLL